MIKKTKEIFEEIHCLTDRSRKLSGVELQRKWFKTADKRQIGQYLQKFLEYNSAMFQFLGVEAKIVGMDSDVGLVFSSTCFIGTIPLRSPDTGKQIGDFIVSPRYSGKDKNAEYIEILDLLGNTVDPHFIHSLPLASGMNFQPPLYLEAIKFISKLEKVAVSPWKKFDVIEKNSQRPSGNVNWSKYFRKHYKVENRLIFPVRANILSDKHKEYAQLNYVFEICRNEVNSIRTPLTVKLNMRSRISILSSKMEKHEVEKTKFIKVSQSDNESIRHCKEIGNNVLNRTLEQATAWKVNFSEVFERFVQYLFKEVAKEQGANFYSNYRFQSRTSSYYTWDLKHLEPDAILQKGGVSIFIDAKYKANFYSRYNEVDTLKEEYRHDLHQILAYSSFSTSSKKFGILCYPSSNFQCKSTRYHNSINNTAANVILIGIPLKKSEVPQLKVALMNEVSLVLENYHASTT